MLWQWLKRKKVTINKVARRWKVNLKTANNHHFSRVTPISKKNIKSSFYSILVIIVNTSEKMLTLSLFFSDCSGKPISQRFTSDSEDEVPKQHLFIWISQANVNWHFKGRLMGTPCSSAPVRYAPVASPVN